VKFCGQLPVARLTTLGLTEIATRGLWALIVSFTGTATAISASADPVLRNVTGFDPALLAGNGADPESVPVRRRPQAEQASSA
jgi:hypothetical protein